MIPTLLAGAVILAATATVLRVASGLGRTLLIAGLAAGSIWLLIACMAVLYQRGGAALLLLVLILASAAAVAIYRRLGSIQALMVGLGIVFATGIALA